MKKQLYLIYVQLLVLAIPLTTLAQTPQQKAAQEAGNFVGKFNAIILFPAIAILSSVAFLVFLYGAAEYVMNSGSDQGRQQGVKHITFGIIGLLVMVSAYALLTIATGTFGLDDELDCADDPSNAACASAFTIPFGP